MQAQHLATLQAPLASAARHIDVNPSLNCSIASLSTQALPFSDLAHYGDMELGKRIKATMKAKKVTSKAMADACGVTPSAVSSWYRTSRISKDALAKVATVLGVSMEELITGESEPLPPKLSIDGERFVYWLTKIKDRDLRDRARDAAMQIIYSAGEGQWPKSLEPPTPEPTPPNKKRRAENPKH